MHAGITQRVGMQHANFRYFVLRPHNFTLNGCTSKKETRLLNVKFYSHRIYLIYMYAYMTGLTVSSYLKIVYIFFLLYFLVVLRSREPVKPEID